MRPTPPTLRLAHSLRLILSLQLLVIGFGGLTAEAGEAGEGLPGPELIVDGSLPTTLGVPVFVPTTFMGHGHEITALAFSLDLDLEALTFDPSDDDGDGIPDVVGFPFGTADLTVVSFDPTDEDGELDVLLVELSGLPFADGLLMDIELLPSQAGQVARWIRFSQDPAASFGDAQGQDVPGTVVVTEGGELFADGFESGDLGGWSTAVP